MKYRSSRQQENYVTPREAQDAAEILGYYRTEEIVGPGGLSGASMRQLVALVKEAKKHKRNPKSPKRRRNPDIGDVFYSIRPGDWVEVTFAARSSTSPDERRTVAVEDRDSRHIYVSSGKVRSGHESGGAIYDYGDGDFYFQPTLQQQIRRVLGLKRIPGSPVVHNPHRRY